MLKLKYCQNKFVSPVHKIHFWALRKILRGNFFLLLSKTTKTKTTALITIQWPLINITLCVNEKQSRMFLLFLNYRFLRSLESRKTFLYAYMDTFSAYSVTGLIFFFFLRMSKVTTVTLILFRPPPNT